MDIYGTAGDDNIENLNSPGVHIWLNVFGRDGNDTIRVAYAHAFGEAGNDTIIGARDYGIGTGGYPTAAYSNSPAGVSVNLATGTAFDGFGTVDTLKNINSVKDSGHSDLFIGSAKADEFLLSRGSDVVYGAGGSDVAVMGDMRSTEVTTTYHIDTHTFSLAKAVVGDAGTTTLIDIETLRYWGMFSDNVTISVTGARSAGETYAGGHGKEIIHSGTGNDSIDAGDGLDTVVYSGARNGYVATRATAGITVTGAQGNDTLTNVERVHFGDAALAFDATGVAGQAYRLYEAAFDRTPDAFGIGFWISAMDKGVSLNAVATEFVNSQEFRQMYSGATNAELVDKLYKNILDRAGDLSGIAHWTGVLDRHEATVADVLAGFSNSAEFVAKLTGVMENGIEFLPYGGA